MQNNQEQQGDHGDNGKQLARDGAEGDSNCEGDEGTLRSAGTIGNTDQGSKDNEEHGHPNETQETVYPPPPPPPPQGGYHPSPLAQAQGRGLVMPPSAAHGHGFRSSPVSVMNQPPPHHHSMQHPKLPYRMAPRYGPPPPHMHQHPRGYGGMPYPPMQQHQQHPAFHHHNSPHYPGPAPGGSPPRQMQHVDPRRSPVHPLEVLPSAVETMRTAGCTCKKSRCLKLYCACFSSSTTCGPTCKCQVCHNTTLHGDAIENARRTILERNPSAFDDKFRVTVHPAAILAGNTALDWHKYNQTGSYPQGPPQPMPRYYPMPNHHHQGPLPPPPPPRHHHPSYPPQMAHSQQAQSPSPPRNSNMAPEQQQQQQQQEQQAAAGAAPPTAPRHSPTMTATSGQSMSMSPSNWPYASNPPRVSPSQMMRQSPQNLPPPTRINKYGCKCRRSFCLKKYCDCYSGQTHCGLNCRCTNCKNFPEAGPPNGGEGNNGAAGPVPIQPQPEGPPREVTVYMDAAQQHRRVSFDGGAENHSIGEDEGNHPSSHDTMSDPHQPKQDTKKGSNEDRMAIMAAVAMTELLGGTRGPVDANKSTGSNTGTSTPTPNLSNEQASKEMETSSNPRRVSTESPSFDEQGMPPLKKAKMAHGAEEISPGLSTLTATTAVSEKSPPPPMVRTPHIHCIKSFPAQLPRFPYGGLMHHHVASPHNGYHPGPPPMHHAAMSPPTGSPPTPHHHMAPHPHRPPPHTPHLGSMTSPGMYNPTTQVQQMTPSSHAQPSPAAMRSSPTYEDVIRSSGLPKSLSFRKICSKCGKTRGEHGELGFGNKCVYQDCGKCGAGVQMHLKANVPMGILCTLTVEDGATPGAAANYERKIRELAIRADLQKELQKRKHEAAERAVAAGAP